MSDPWDPERSVDAGTARRLVAGARPGLADADLTLLGAGWDNTVWRVDHPSLDGPRAVRFPRRDVAVPLLLKERHLLPRVAPGVTLAVPVPDLEGDADLDDAYPWPWGGGALVPGTEAALADVLDEGALAVAWGGFLARLHADALRDRLADLGLPVDPLHRGWPARRRPRTQEWLERLRGRLGGKVPGPALTDPVLDAADRLPAPSDLALVHGDLHLRHVLVDASGRATGVIDWGDACLADPAVDLSLLYAALGADAREAAFAAYGVPVPASRRLRARALAVGLCAALALAAEQQGETRLLSSALAGMDRALR